MHLTKTWFCLLLLTALLSCERKQEFLRIDSYSSYTFNSLPTSVAINHHINSYEALIRKAMAYTGINDSNVRIATIDTFGAFFAINKTTLQRYFLYSPAFFDSVLSETHSQNALFSICFHELAHMFYNHPLKPSRFSRVYELQADYYSGFESKVIQAGIGEATKAISIFGSWTETESHPAKTVRMDEIQSGYLDACEKLPPHCSDSLMRLALKRRGLITNTVAFETNSDNTIAMGPRLGRNQNKVIYYDRTKPSLDIQAGHIFNPLSGKYNLYGDTIIVDGANIVRTLHEKEPVGKIEKDQPGTNVLNIDGVKFYLTNELLYSITPSGATLNAGYKID